MSTLAPMVTKVLKRPPTHWMNDDLRNAMKDQDEPQSTLEIDRHFFYNKDIKQRVL